MVDVGEPAKCGLYTMDESLSKIIKSRTSHDEIEASYSNIITKMIEILHLLLENNLCDRETILLLYNGNIWEIIGRYSICSDSIPSNKQRDSYTSDQNEIESLHSSKYSFTTKPAKENILIKINQNKRASKVGNYLDRK